MKMPISKRMRCAILAMAGAAIFLLMQAGAQAQSSELRVHTGEHYVHVMPSADRATELAAIAPLAGPMTYHGGPVMTRANTYAIFWVPPTLQTGAATSLSSHYQSVVRSMLSLYPSHGIDDNNTQYYARSGLLSWYYVQNAGGLAGAYIDSSPYPASGCFDGFTPGNCLTDGQIQAEIQKVMTLKGWTGGLTKMFLLFTSSGEGSCAGASCAYSQYCAYHSYFLNGTTPVIYGNEPYSDPSFCQVPGTPSPNGDAAADAAANVASHELTEAITDPELNAWYAGSLSGEIGDLCAWVYGPNTWDSGNANQSWFETYSIFGSIGNFELQEEYDNHTGSCVQVGP